MNTTATATKSPVISRLTSVFQGSKIYTPLIARDNIFPTMIVSSERWKNILSEIPLTTPENNYQTKLYEEKRFRLAFNWMFNQLNQLQQIADKYEFGQAWKEMCKSQSLKSRSSAGYLAQSSIGKFGKTFQDRETLWSMSYASDAAARVYGVPPKAMIIEVAYSVCFAARAYESEFGNADSFWEKANCPDLVEKLIKVDLSHLDKIVF